ncbi:MAG: hypothetical protein WCO05_03635 [Candidatus Moraniibacteriota bacterium]
MPYNENMPVPYGQENAPKKIKVTIVDTSDALEREAFTAAEAKMTENKESLRGFKGIFKKIWKHNLFHEYYRQKEVFIARKKIEESGNVYVNEKLGKEAHDLAMGSVMERFVSEYEEEMIHEGEEKKTISSDSQEGGELKKRIGELIQNYAKGNLSEEQFIAEKNVVFGNELQSVKGDSGKAIIQKGKMYADNLLEIAKQLRQSIEHGAKLEELDTDFDIVVGRARSGERTEAQFNRVDRWLGKIQKIKFIGSIANEATVAAAVSAVYALGTKVALGGARAASKILGPLGFGISAGIGGAVAGARESKRLKEERAQHARERARGKTFEKGAERRAEMEQFQYETKSASGLAHDLETSLERLKADPQKASLDLLFTKLNEVEGRITFSDRSNIDLIHYSDVKSIEKERTRLDRLRAEAKVYVRKLLAEKKAGKVEINLPFDNEAGFKDYLFLAKEIEFEDKFSKEKEQKDKAFNKMKQVKVAKAVAKGFAIGIGVGVAVQEVATIWNDAEGVFTPSSVHAADVSPGLSEPTPMPRYTSLEYVRRMFAGELHQNYGGPYAETIIGQNHFNLPSGFALQNGPTGLNLMRGHDMMLSGLKLKPDGTLTDESLRLLQGQGITADAVPIGIPGKGILDQRIIDNSNYNLPQGFSFVKNPAGTYDLIGPKGPGGNISVENLKLNPDGSLSQEAKDVLTQRGVSWGNVTEHISDAKHQEYIFDPKEYVAKHVDKFHRISRLWYDNDTPKPKFDHNELKLRWGGVHGTGIDKSGKFVMDVSHMTKDESFHSGISADAQKLMGEGKLKMLFSLTRGTQNNVIEVPINAQGHISIDPSSENGKMLFEMDAKGHALFKGKFAEVAQSLGMKNGVEQMGILATHTGNGLGPIRDVIDIPAVDKTSTFLQVAEHSTKFMIPSDYEVDWPFVIPMAGRRPMEGPSKKPDGLPIAMPYYYSYEGISPDMKEIIERRLSPTLKDNPEAVLDHFFETKRYLDGITGKEREEVEKLAKEAGSMGAKNKLTVCIPVAGHQEEKNIYESLKNYTYQNANVDDYELMLFVNYPERDKQGKKIEPDGTADEIRRFQKDYPNINVKVIERVLPVKDANIGKIRKMLNDTVLLRQHQRGPGAPELIMVSNDADNKGISPEYIQNFIDKFEANPAIDGMLGQLDWDPESYVKYPLVHLGTRLFQYLNTARTHKTGDMLSSGANFAFRSGIFSAVGGYVDATEGGEDIAIGFAINEARGGNKTISFAGANVSRLYTSSRRAIDALKSGLTPVEQWNKGFSAFDDEIRRFEMGGEEVLDYTDPGVQAKFKVELEQVINRTLNIHEGGEVRGKDSWYIKRALGWLGLKYIINGKGVIEITDMSRLLEGLIKYQKEGVLMRDAKSGKKEAEEALRKMRNSGRS